jgi:hypothetical protein
VFLVPDSPGQHCQSLLNYAMALKNRVRRFSQVKGERTMRNGNLMVMLVIFVMDHMLFR